MIRASGMHCRGVLTRHTGAMVCTEHDTHVDEPGGVFGQRPLEPEQGDDVAHSVVTGDEGAHVDTIVGGLLSAVIADGRHNVGGHPDLQQCYFPR